MSDDERWEEEEETSGLEMETPFKYLPHGVDQELWTLLGQCPQLEALEGGDIIKQFEQQKACTQRAWEEVLERHNFTRRQIECVSRAMGSMQLKMDEDEMGEESLRVDIQATRCLKPTSSTSKTERIEPDRKTN